MRKYLFLLVVLAMAACKKDTLLTYSPPDNIYFDYGAALNNPVDSLGVSFAYSPATVRDSILVIPVAVTGSPSGHDRSYGIVVDPASSAVAGTHYELPDSFVFRAGHVLDTLSVTLLRAQDLQDTTRFLILHLHAGKDFSTGMPFIYNGSDTVSTLTFTIALSDQLTPGPYWTSVFTPYFGTFSVRKVQLMNQVVGMPLNFWVNLNNLNLSAQASYFAITMSRYLKNQALAGDTIYEADGVTPMTMGAAYQ
ncbi:MAG TPA: DUF4843 domain-containing protein [Dinghuibacter sp.]|uniref:DUF4843 domain-containing protein n=1 Tax=Dinghuibacter sp. TaxID=2024697 RepID=UPI002BCE6AF5|nr:DUF4843 domain-containing protein [Dinghuibacter sp.]HTJ13731.1 DUF4843 domain-containing protein [Dinghuibacter sp.]